MSYRYWLKTHPTWPKKLGDLEGKKVRLVRQIETRGGEVFSEGLVMRVESVWRGSLMLQHLTDSRAIIRRVPLRDVNPIPD